MQVSTSSARLRVGMTTVPTPKAAAAAMNLRREILPCAAWSRNLTLFIGLSLVLPAIRRPLDARIASVPCRRPNLSILFARSSGDSSSFLRHPGETPGTSPERDPGLQEHAGCP